MTASTGSRTERLVQARKRDSDIKRKRALDAMHLMPDSGQRVSFTSVAWQARVSTWLLYNVPELKRAVQKAIDTQIQSPPPNGRLKGGTLPELFATTELALARAEIKQLRAENAKLITRLRAMLGAGLELVDRQELIDRIHELEQAAQSARREKTRRITPQRACSIELQNSMKKWPCWKR
jgi:chromatin segregation and condensation protein Rec8/ScpA/Scc1 (kleisin family)